MSTAKRPNGQNAEEEKEAKIRKTVQSPSSNHEGSSATSIAGSLESGRQSSTEDIGRSVGAVAGGAHDVTSVLPPESLLDKAEPPLPDLPKPLDPEDGAIAQENTLPTTDKVFISDVAVFITSKLIFLIFSRPLLYCNLDIHYYSISKMYVT